MGGPIFELTLTGSGSNYSNNYAGKCFYSGQTITGKVEFETKKQIKNVNIISVNFEGEKAVRWNNDEYNGQEASRGKVKECETIVDKRVFVKWWPTANIDIGKYVFPFSFNIPKDIPCSFEGRYGHVRYLVKAKLGQGKEGQGIIFFSGLKRMMFITINNPINLNSIRACKHPVSVEESITVGNFGWKSGTMSCTVKTPRVGYTSGETIKLSICINNKSDRRVVKAQVKLIMCIVYKSRCNSSKTENNVCAKTNLKDVLVGDNTSWTSMQVPIPAVPASNLRNTTNFSFIDISYRIEIHVTPSGLEYKFGLLNNKLVLGLPIIIGVIPLRNLHARRSGPVQQNGEGSGNTLESVDDSGEPFAPLEEIDEYELPPPTYEEAMLMNHSRLGQFKDVSDSYRPMYPIWNLD